MELSAVRNGTDVRNISWPFIVVFLAWAAATIWAKTLYVDLSGFDFRAYYTAGRMVLEGVGADFYDLQTQYAWQRSFIPELTDMQYLLPFLNPPFAALVFAPLATLSFAVAYIVWLGVNLGLLATVVWQCARALRHLRPTVKLVVLAILLTYPPVLATVLHGQLSFVLVIALLSGWRALGSGRDLAAGLCLSLLLLKPHFVLVVVLTFIVQRRYRALAGLGLGCGVLSTASVMLVGPSGLRRYLDLLASIPGWGNSYGVHPQHMHTWRSFVHRLLGTDDAAEVHVLWLAGVAVALALLLWVAVRQHGSRSAWLDLDYATLVVVALLVAPHANMHDLSILVVPGLLVTRYTTLQSPGRSLYLILAGLPWVGYGTVWASVVWNDALPLQITVPFVVLMLAGLTYARVHERKRALR